MTVNVRAPFSLEIAIAFPVPPIHPKATSFIRRSQAYPPDGLTDCFQQRLMFYQSLYFNQSNHISHIIFLNSKYKYRFPGTPIQSFTSAVPGAFIWISDVRKLPFVFRARVCLRKVFSNLSSESFLKLLKERSSAYSQALQRENFSGPFNIHTHTY